MTITIRTENHYGTEHTYVVEPALRDTIAGLTHKKTVDEQDIRMLERLGFIIKRA